MSFHAWGGDSPGLAGKHHWGAGSLGIPGAQIAVGGYLDTSIDQTAEAADEFYGVWGGVPSGLVPEEVGEDGGIVLSSVPTNAYYAIPFDLYRFGAKIGSSTFSATFGTLAAGANLSVLTMTGGGSVATAAVTAGGAAASIDLAAAGLSGGASIATGAITFTPAAAGTVNLVGASMSGGSGIGAGLVTLPGAPVDLFAAPMSGGSLISSGAITNQVYARAPDGSGYTPQHTYGPVRPANSQGSTR